MSVEGQRLLQYTVEKFVERSTAQSAELVKLTEAIAAQSGELVDLTTASGTQTDKVVALTDRLKTLTVWIAWLTVAAAVFGGIQAIAVLVHLYRWYRGWL